MNKIVKDFEIEFSNMKYSTLKDVSSKDYQESSFRILGLRVQDFKKYKSKYYNSLNQDQKFKFLDMLFNQSQIFEVVSWSLYELDKFDIDYLIEKKQILTLWANRVENWQHSDLLSSIYVKILDNHKIFYQTLKGFNEHSNNWKKRLSLTSLYYFSSARDHPIQFELAIDFVEKSLFVEDYYVQKGLGWSLKEMSQIYYDKTLDFIKMHIKHISPDAYSHAIEKLKDKDREEVKAIRKRGVSNKYEFIGHQEEKIN